MSLWDAKPPKNESSRPITNTSNISRWGQNFPRWIWIGLSEGCMKVEDHLLTWYWCHKHKQYSVHVHRVIYNYTQGAKKIIFTACHSGKLKLAFTSPEIISTSPKSFLMNRIYFTVLLLFEFLKKHHLPVRQVKNRIHLPNSKIHLPQAIGHYFLCTLNYNMYISKMVTNFIYLLYRTDGLVNRKVNSVVAKRSSAY